MTGWIIFGAIVLFILIILWQSITVTFDYENKLNLKVKFLFFTIYTTDPRKQKKKKQKKEKKSKKKKANTPTDEAPEAAESTETAESSEAAGNTPSTAQTDAKPVKKKRLSIDLEMIMDYVRSAAPPLKRLFKKIRWYDVYVDWVVGSDDAAKTAITYGSVCGVLYPFFEWLTTYFTAHVREVHLEADFSKEESDIFAYFVLKLRLSTALVCLIWLAWRVLKAYSKYNSQPKQVKSKRTPKKKGK